MDSETDFTRLDPKKMESGTLYRYDPDCVRKRGNFGPSNAKYLFDSVQRWKFQHGQPPDNDDEQHNITQTAGAPKHSRTSLKIRKIRTASQTSLPRRKSAKRSRTQTRFYQNQPTPPETPDSSSQGSQQTQLYDETDDNESDTDNDSTAPESAIEQDSGFLTPELLEFYSPKLNALLQKIKEQDEHDQKTDQRLYKHFIFTDLKMGPHGAKIIATALQDIFHYPLAYRANYQPAKDKWSKIQLLTDDELQATPYQNTVLLSSVSVYQQPIPLKMRKEILQRFNQRPENIYGKNVRFIIMDSGFKEGIDLFDIKYVHVFEPQTTPADLKQVIGRGTRTCGQQGLRFQPTQGWPLHVQVYDTTFPEELQSFRYFGAHTVHELYLKSLGLDVRLITLATEMEEICKEGAVDADLNKPVHEFSVAPVHSRSSSRSRTQSAGRPASSLSMEEQDEWEKIRLDTPIAPPSIQAMVPILTGASEPPLTYDGMKRYIQQHFSQYQWPPVKMENLCEEAPFIPKTPPKYLPRVPANTPTTPSAFRSDRTQTAGSKIVQYTPTQGFVSHYFTPENNRKGMLFYHSVGTGKTCSAIATATHRFEKEGYTILWVTRTTLKNDIWKNMFDQVCSESIRDYLQRGNTMPQEQKARVKLLSKSWSIQPMSYKQFTNLVSQKNAFYKALVKKNGEEDPLRKTLLIIDEAHKLYGGADLSSIERPDMQKLQEAIQYSYRHSGQDSVRLLLMTATPMTTSPLEIVQLINLFKPVTQLFPAIPEDIETFSLTYLDQQGHFTPQGRRLFLDQISGHISYLNREKDARVFSQPIVQHINVPIVTKQHYETYDFALTSKLIQTQQKIERELATQQKQQIKQANQDFQGVTQKSLEFLDKVCASIEDPKHKTLCNRLKRQTAKRITDSVKLRKEQMKQKIDQAMDKVKQLTQKRKDIKNAFELVKKRPENLNRYRNSAFHHVDSTCRQSTVEEYLQPLSEIQQIRDVEKQNLEYIELTKKQQKEALGELRKETQQAKKDIQAQIKSTHDPPLKKYLREQLQELVKVKAQQEKRQQEADKKHIEALEKQWKIQKTKHSKIMRTTLKRYREYLKKTAKNQRLEKQQEEKAKNAAKVFEEIADIQNEELREFSKQALQDFKQELKEEWEKIQKVPPKTPAQKKPKTPAAATTAPSS
jgi:hypothetical protein